MQIAIDLPGPTLSHKGFFYWFICTTLLIIKNIYDLVDNVDNMTISNLRQYLLYTMWVITNIQSTTFTSARPSYKESMNKVTAV